MNQLSKRYQVFYSGNTNKKDRFRGQEQNLLTGCSGLSQTGSPAGLVKGLPTRLKSTQQRGGIFDPHTFPNQGLGPGSRTSPPSHPSFLARVADHVGKVAGERRTPRLPAGSRTSTPAVRGGAGAAARPGSARLGPARPVPADTTKLLVT